MQPCTTDGALGFRNQATYLGSIQFLRADVLDITASTFN